MSSLRLFLFLKYLNFCSDFFDLVRLDKKATVNFKICNVVNLDANNQNKHIGKCLKKKRQSDNKIWSVNRI